MSDSVNINSVGAWRLTPTQQNTTGNMPASNKMASSSPLIASSSSSSTSASSKLSTSIGKTSSSTSASAMRIKRGHVSKACTNCRKMHAACDRARPCSRCVFNKLENSCIDIPRKKRVSKKKQDSGEESATPETGNSGPDIIMSKKDPPSQSWSADIFIDQQPQQKGENTTTQQPQPTVSNKSTISSSTTSTSSSNTTLPDDSIPEIWTESTFLPEPLFLSELLAEEEKRIYSTQADGYPSASPRAQSLSSVTLRTAKQEATGLSSNNNNNCKHEYEVQYLLQEVDRLKDTNNDLTTKLSMVTDELADVKLKMQSLCQVLGSLLMPRDQMLSSINSTNTGNTLPSLLSISSFDR